MSIGGIRRGLAVMVGALALVSMNAMAQAPQGGPQRGGGGMGMMGGTADRPTTIERLGLNDASLNLTAAQKGEIDKIVDAYLVEQTAVREKYPMTQGAQPNQETMTAMRTALTAARDKMNTAVGKVLDDKQRTAWQAAQAARAPQGGPGGGAGGPRGPGGGAPPGGR